jgi:hypothetical protein
MGSQQAAATLPPPPASYPQQEPVDAQEDVSAGSTPASGSVTPVSGTRGESPQPQSSGIGPSVDGPDKDAESLARLIETWPDVIQAVRSTSRVAAAAWEGSVPHSLVDGALTVRVPAQGQAVSIRSSRRDLAMHTLLIQEFGTAVEVTATAVAEVDHTDDTPSEDDPDLGEDSLSGVDLAMRELGATKIGEFEGG